MTKNLTEFLKLIQVVDPENESLPDMEPAEFAEKLKAAIKWLNLDLKDNKSILENKFRLAPAFVVKMFQKLRELILEHNLTKISKKICNIFDFYFKLQMEAYFSSPEPARLLIEEYLNVCIVLNHYSKCLGMLQEIKDTNPLCKSAINELSNGGPWYKDTYLLKWIFYHDEMAWKSHPHSKYNVPNIVFDQLANVSA